MCGCVRGCVCINELGQLRGRNNINVAMCVLVGRVCI